LEVAQSRETLRSGGTGLEKRRVGEAVLFNEGEYIKFDDVKNNESKKNINEKIK
jgi:hypothetical protein